MALTMGMDSPSSAHVPPLRLPLSGYPVVASALRTTADHMSRSSEVRDCTPLHASLVLMVAWYRSRAKVDILATRCATVSPVPRPDMEPAGVGAEGAEDGKKVNLEGPVPGVPAPAAPASSGRTMGDAAGMGDGLPGVPSPGKTSGPHKNTCTFHIRAHTRSQDTMLLYRHLYIQRDHLA